MKEEELSRVSRLTPDSRNIEEISVAPDEKRFRPRKSPEEMDKLKNSGVTFEEYRGMMADMEDGTLSIDDISQFETEKLLEIYKPDIFCAGIKEKYAVQKSGIPLKQLHSYDYGGPYAGFRGAINFYNDMKRILSTKIWTYSKAPWQEESGTERQIRVEGIRGGLLCF